jgi:hypothetical protein
MTTYYKCRNLDWQHLIGGVVALNCAMPKHLQIFTNNSKLACAQLNLRLHFDKFWPKGKYNTRDLTRRGNL